MNEKVSKDTKSKRPRVVLACNRCRQRKTKCDGQQPVCGGCMKKQVECSYGVKYNRAHVTVEYVRQLEEKLGIAPDSTDAMGAGSMDKKRRGKDRDYYGSSAAISFMKDISNVIDGSYRSELGSSTTTEDERDTEKSNVYRMSRNDAAVSRRTTDIVLPPRAMADRYVKNYFEYAYTLYPFVHQPTFMATYQTIWSNNDDDNEIDELFYSIVNIIFAFGCQLTPEPEKLEDNSELYFERSQELLRFHLMDTGSILLVQALLLTGQFLQASTGSAGCWNIVGLSIRIAQGLGLHSEQNYASAKSLIDREIRKRLWQGCLLMDRIVSMTMGRPLMVTQDNESGELPLCVDDEYIKDDAILPMKTPSKIGFFIQTIKLYNILADILKQVYPNEIQDDVVQLLLNIFNFENRLNEFRANLPEYLQYKSDERKMMPFERQSIVLHIRTLHMKIMLYRPTLFPKSSRNHTHTSELYTSTQKSVAISCVKLAVELIDLIGRYRAGDIIYLPAHWYNVFYIYTAANVLLAAKLQVGLHRDLDLATFENAWNHSLEILGSYTQHSESASRCLKVLEMMGNKVNISSQRLATQRNTPVPHLHHDSDHLHPASTAVPGSVYPLHNYSPSSTSSEVPTDVLYSLLYDTAGPFGGPFHYSDDPNVLGLR
ncbi:uncharacterized protein SPAPADRAFT_53773 [Spathaspora passalidarum NRRL Y-27907]|uniref:Uncharacterized protein NACB1 n=1 Tax=Spathaspora passalidarum (strain NRRL Y-27907 / 11-Y1) TaxID=619300 RepID=G3AE24_SPAPN|nr:uncharacterized protein SPAPADRAFT_53773 [Spathaspora passalidarum NRRL Y-27907]EGW35558.1 hypothetical protein SPAPADRAFT_53773 [Spathaspora passalidarum NRRL Y-27907]